MASAKRYSPEQIVAKLREHEKLQGQGLTIPASCIGWLPGPTDVKRRSRLTHTLTLSKATARRGLPAARSSFA